MMASWLNSKLALGGAAVLGMGLAQVACDDDAHGHPMICTRETRNHCLTPAQIESLLVSKEARIVTAKRTESGGNGAWVLTLDAPLQGRSVEFRVKWRPDSTRSGANSPRKELAAYAMQRLFLDPVDYVHPPTRSRCFDLEHYRSAVEPNAKPSFPKQSSCVFGSVAYWVEGASTLTKEWYYKEPLLNEQRWQRDATFRRTLADANLLTYLTLNGDTHSGNWLKVETDAGLHVYMVDSSISFSRHRNASLTIKDDFSAIVVPLRKQSVERLMRIDQAALESLSAIERIYPEGDWLRSEWVAHEGNTPSGEHPYEFVACPAHLGCKTQMVLGLTEDERQLVLGELWHLQMRVEMGEIAVLDSEPGP